jgi:hypothetical protein
MKLKEGIKNKPEAFLNLINKWVMIKNIKNSIFISKGLAQMGLRGNNVLGYSFVDHLYGLSIVIVKIIEINDDKLTLSEGPFDKGSGFILRYHSFLNLEISIIPPEGVKELDLPEMPRGMEVYSSPEQVKIRENEMLHPFRAEGFPDDVKILLPPIGGLNPELVWGRVEKINEEDKIFYCELIDSPKQDFKVQAGELVDLVPVLVSGEKPQLLCKTAFDRLKS